MDTRKIFLALIMFVAGATEVAGATTYTVGVENLQYYPLHTTRNGEYAGYARDVLDAFAAQKGYTFQYQPLPINRLFASYLKERSLDFKYPDNPKWQPDLRVGTTLAYSLPIVVSEEGGMVLPQNKGRNVKQLKSLGTVIGFTPWPYMDAINGKNLTVFNSGSFEGLLRDAMANRIDVIYINTDVANHMLKEVLKTPGGLVFDPGLPFARSDFSLSSIRHGDVIEEFNAFLQKERALLDRLRAKYKMEERAAH